LAETVCRVPARRNVRPDWIRQRQRQLGNRIADLRRAAELSQEQLADRMGVERRTVQRYENAVTDPRYADLLLIAQALRVHVTDLLS
jgi:transcriptional regulator with XRE-family HTH domain